MHVLANENLKSYLLIVYYLFVHPFINASIWMHLQAYNTLLSFIIAVQGIREGNVWLSNMMELRNYQKKVIKLKNGLIMCHHVIM